MFVNRAKTFSTQFADILNVLVLKLIPCPDGNLL